MQVSELILAEPRSGTNYRFSIRQSRLSYHGMGSLN